MIHHKMQQKFSTAPVCPLHVTLMEPQGDALEHRHDFLELVVVLRGDGEQYGGRYKEEVRKGDIFLIPPGVSHGYRNGSPDFSLINILFLPESLPISRLDIALLPGFQTFYTGKNSSSERYPGIHTEGKTFQKIASLAKELHAEYRSERSGFHFCCIGIFMQLLCQILRLYSPSGPAEQKETLLSADIFSYMSNHYRKEITVAELCRFSHMSKSTLMRHFSNAAGCSPICYLIRLRISEAMPLLSSTSLSIAEIACQTGFRDSNYFCRQFKKITGVTPLTFRKNQSEKLKKVFPTA